MKGVNAEDPRILLPDHLFTWKTFLGDNPDVRIQVLRTLQNSLAAGHSRLTRPPTTYSREINLDIADFWYVDNWFAKAKMIRLQQKASMRLTGRLKGLGGNYVSFLRHYRHRLQFPRSLSAFKSYFALLGVTPGTSQDIRPCSEHSLVSNCQYFAGYCEHYPSTTEPPRPPYAY